MFKELATRKFLLGVLIIVCTTGLTFTDKIDAALYEQIAIWVMGIFAGANVSQKIFAKK